MGGNSPASRQVKVARLRLFIVISFDLFLFFIVHGGQAIRASYDLKVSTGVKRHLNSLHMKFHKAPKALGH